MQLLKSRQSRWRARVLELQESRKNTKGRHPIRNRGNPMNGVHNTPHAESCACIHCRLRRAEENVALYKGIVEEAGTFESIRNGDLVLALRNLVTRCDGAEGVRADGSNICTLEAHAALGDLREIPLHHPDDLLRAVVEHIAPMLKLYEPNMPEHPVIQSIREYLSK